MATATRKRKSSAKKNNLLVELNQVALTTTDELVEGAIASGAKWQKLYAKSLKQSIPLTEKNVDVAVDAIESFITFHQKNVKRVGHLFSADTKKVKKVASKVAKKTTAVTKPVVKKATSVAKALASKTTNAAKKVVTSDLKVLPGVGPKMEALLKKNGYKTIDSIAKAKVAELKAVLDTADSRYRLLNPNSWITSAKRLAK